MATLLPAAKGKVWLIYLKHTLRARGNLSPYILREICSYFADLQLVLVTASFLRFFDCPTCTWGLQVSLRTQIQADEGSSWVFLEDGRLFCSGGGNYHAGYSEWSIVYSASWKKAYLLGLDGKVDQLPNMLTARTGHGIIQLGHIYVFGGGKP